MSSKDTQSETPTVTKVVDEVLVSDALDMLSQRLNEDKGLIREVPDCARCGETHHVKFIPLTKPMNSLPDHKWFGICPVNGEPLLMREG